MNDAILFTQCLQNDFVQLIDRYDPLPNLLHVGHSESMRLLGERIEEGPVQAVMAWAYQTKPEDLSIVHIRDWHDASDPAQADHLRQFGAHCLHDTKGAQFVFSEAVTNPGRHIIVDASGLNDFVDTKLDEVLRPWKDKPFRAGIMGVWTEAKVLFLAYDLRTRFPRCEIGVCSALTASSSRANHFIALDQLKNVLGVQVFASVGDFTGWLAGSMPPLRKTTHARIDTAHLHFEDGSNPAETDQQILLYLFRDCNEVRLNCLDGGFSGNVVMRATSVDLLGHAQVPSVIKIGPRQLIAAERTSFERIQEVMGNSAPTIVDFAEIGDRGGIKYRYAAMLGGKVQTFQDLYEKGMNQKEIASVLDIVFRRQLGRLYEAARLEKLDLLGYYDFKPKYAASVRRKVEEILGGPASESEIEIMPGLKVSNPCRFYEEDLAHLREENAASHYTAYVHGDLNGRNIIIDGQKNVWLIDFFHTQSGHVLRDLLKLENDVLYIFCKLQSEAELGAACAMSKALLEVDDLAAYPSENEKWMKIPELARAFQTIRELRRIGAELVETDRDPYQIHVGLLRYAMHTLSFDESSLLQRRWALYSGALCIDKVRRHLENTRRLRIDFLPAAGGKAGRIGLTILPGRRDRDRSLAEDLDAIQKAGIKSVLSLVTTAELELYGVPNLISEIQKVGLEVKRLPIADQGTPTREEIHDAVRWMSAQSEKGDVLVHCVGGLGRSGLLAACYLVIHDHRLPADALAVVREARSPRAVETKAQEDLVYASAEALKTN